MVCGLHDSKGSKRNAKEEENKQGVPSSCLPAKDERSGRSSQDEQGRMQKVGRKMNPHCIILLSMCF